MAEVLGAIILALTFLMVAYHLVLAVVALSRPVSAGERLDGTAASRFLVMIPAHDEEQMISETLRSVLAVDYPRDLFSVRVIADNCSDRTAEITRSCEVECLERHDPDNPGKGAALNWAVQQLREPEEVDAVLILDADCEIDPQTLRVFDQRLRGGADAVQARYVASNPDQSAISYVLALGNTVENDLYYRAKSVLGWVTILRGTGMAFRREVLQATPWSAASVVEDQQLTVSLLEAGARIDYVPWIDVRSPFPATVEQMGAQRTRWMKGSAELSTRFAGKAVGAGLLRLDGRRIDIGLTILSQSRVLHLALIAAAIAYAGGGLLVTSTPFFEALLWSAIGLATAYGLYIGLGVLVLGLTWRRLGYLFAAPAVAGRLAWVAIQSRIARDPGWVRTPRG